MITCLFIKSNSGDAQKPHQDSVTYWFIGHIYSAVMPEGGKAEEGCKLWESVKDYLKFSVEFL